MEYKDYQIGYYVHAGYPLETNIDRIKGIHGDSYSLEKGTSFTFRADYLSPVGVTLQWLETLGLTWSKMGSEQFNIPTWENEMFYILIKRTTSQPDEPGEFMIVPKYGRPDVRISFVHELQNYYFSKKL